ncbi:MAG: GNAT family N-acetyltransferase [Rhodobacteraceae bacterium]|jgi:ribosomal protein S18 acetylase RimI-like enzyme|nr:GNAT family N-acetyltransferase [Paracoccaceae bacterium]
MTKLILAGPDDLDHVLRLLGDFHAETGITQDEATRRAALAPLLDGSPHGCVYLAGPARAPIGCVVVVFGWSTAFGGMEGKIDVLYIRPGVRGRGIGSEILATLPKALGAAGLAALHLDVARENNALHRLYAKQHFRARDNILRMTRKL